MQKAYIAQLPPAKTTSGPALQKQFVADATPKASTVPDGYGARDAARKRRLDYQREKDAQEEQNRADWAKRVAPNKKAIEDTNAALLEQSEQDMYNLNSHLNEASLKRGGLPLGSVELSQFKAMAGIREPETFGPQIMPDGSLRIVAGCPGKYREQEARIAAARGRR